MIDIQSISYRLPDYSLGRFFLSPILGCKARCSYCYIFSQGYDARIICNQFSIDESIHWIVNHPEYRAGVGGSIISIGAWGDPFPPNSSEASEFTFQWIERLCALGNPIQLLSRFELSQSTVDRVCSSIRYENQLLYSTSISTFLKWQDIELNSAPPVNRLRTLVRFHNNNVPTNLMIKPFLNGITDQEVSTFISYMHDYSVKYCVVGALHWDENIYKFMNRTKRGLTSEVSNLMEKSSREQLFDCTSDQSLFTYSSNLLNDFIGKLSEKDIHVFKKSSCVNSYILEVENISLFYEKDPNSFCVQCGICNDLMSNFD